MTSHPCRAPDPARRPSWTACVAQPVSCLLASLALASCASPPLRIAVPPPPQVATLPDSAGPCPATVPDSLMGDTELVYLHAVLLDAGSRPLLPQADVLGQRVAHRLRLLLGSRADSVPRGEPLISWRNDIGGNLAVTLRRDGRLTWQELLPMPIPDTLPTRLLARALAAVVEHGESVSWSTESARDSVAVRLALSEAAEPIYASGVGLGFPVFKVRRPVETRPARVAGPPPPYPPELREAGVTGTVIIEATIDTAGRAEPWSIHDLWPPHRPPLEGQQLDAYRQFVAAAAIAVRNSRYTPGRIGNCPVRVRIQVPVNFGIEREP